MRTPARCADVGSLVGRRFEGVVSLSPLASLASNPTLGSIRGAVEEDFLGVLVFNEGSVWNFEDQVFARSSLAEIGAALLAIFCFADSAIAVRF